MKGKEFQYGDSSGLALRMTDDQKCHSERSEESILNIGGEDREMKKLLVVVFILSVTLFVHQYGEAAVSNLQQGKSELGGNIDITGTSSTVKTGSYSSTDSSASTSLGFTYGYFLTDAVQLAGRLFATGTSSGSGSTESVSTTTYYYLEGKYHFYSKGQDMIPYLGLGLGALNIKSDSTSGSGSSYSFMGGFKYFISENTSINTELNISSNKYSMGSADITAATTRLWAGFSLYF